MKKVSLKIKLFHLWFRLTRAMTLGVRVIIQDEHGGILLLRHTYVKGWHLPGGGVEVGQKADEAVIRELLEETGLECKSTPKLLGIYLNQNVSSRDHVLLYKIDKWQQAQAFKPNAEIAEIGFYPQNALPDGTTQSTKDRLAEILSGQEQSNIW